MVLPVHSEHCKRFASHVGVDDTSRFYYCTDVFTLGRKKFHLLISMNMICAA
jgi:hypothetical protein